MSMHEFEDLVEESVRVLAGAANRDALDLRSMFWRLYDFQNHWDTGFTHFRVIDILLDARFVYHFERTQHPDYARYRAYFDGLTAFTFIRAEPLQDGGDTFFTAEDGWSSTNPVAGYFNPPFLYADAGSPLWRRWAEAGLLTGRDAQPPDASISLVEVARTAVRTAAGTVGALPFIAAWYALLSAHLARFTPNLDALADDDALADFLTIVRETDAVETALDQVPLMRYRYYFPPVTDNRAEYISHLRAFQRMQDDPNL
jgi:hypothetical protein